MPAPSTLSFEKQNIGHDSIPNYNSRRYTDYIDIQLGPHYRISQGERKSLSD